MKQNFDNSPPMLQPDIEPKKVDKSNTVPFFSFSPPTPVYAMAYGGINNKNSNADIEYRLQKLERGQKVVRRGRVVSSVPQFRSQGVLSQTSANNPFTSHTTGGISYPAGQVPDIVAPFTNNSNIKFPDKT